MSDHQFDLYSWNTPNGQKAVIALEEAGAKYTYRPIDISKGEQHTPQFKALSPDGKIPVLVTKTSSVINHFESGAILLYLAELYPALHGSTSAERAQVMSWTLWQVGQLGPHAGQFGRFSGAPTSNPAATEHFEQLVWRSLDVLEKRLTQSVFLAGESFTVADIASIPWVASKQSYLQRYSVAWREKCPSLKRWADTLLLRPSVIKAFGLTD